MLTLPPLESLGPRICVCGPSNAGKSTLAAALARRMGVDPTYLDLLHHQPHTNWVARPREEFDAAHSAAIARDRWVIEGNYMRLLPERMHRATGILLLGTDRWSAFGRYLRRTLFEHQRHGMLDGAQDSLKWVMIRYILIEQPRKRERDINLLRATGLPMVQLSSMRELQAAYAVWGLERPPVTSPPA
ncbi:MAG: adenylate kinaserelated kinase [Devosia sp.]|uniref:AAA family ATPase n=1 Tax=Devosia sp. TaxID=1871048 RepID=UPI00262219DC|nr:AAA family ATPase [Devosia sp.]MDB5528638.1 adenylate kinaserelated kinase [Devosia sp.]